MMITAISNPLGLVGLGASRCLVAACMLSGLASATPVQIDSPKRPNVLIVMVDDMGFGDLSLAGNPDLNTPHLDAMASRSASFETFYVSPVCGLTRAALMSGRYPHRVGVHANGRDMNPGTRTIAKELQSAGYATGIFGKWHLGDYFPSRPVDFGFEKSVVSRGGIIGQLAPNTNTVRYSDPYLMVDGQLRAFEGYATDVHFAQALDWMEAVQDEGRPFFAFLSTNAPHRPYGDVPMPAYTRLRESLLGQAQGELATGQALTEKELQFLDNTARYYAMVERIDDNMGRLFERLTQNGLLEKTLVFFFSDNGPVPGHFNGGLRGGKGQVFEGGVRSQFFAHWPGVLAPRTKAKGLAAHIDLLPTLLAVCGVHLSHEVDGINLWPVLLGKADLPRDRHLVFEAHSIDSFQRYRAPGAVAQNFSLRTHDFKLVCAGGYGGDSPEAKLELYDMRVDPGEVHDLASSMPERVENLLTLYQPYSGELQQSIKENIRKGQRRIEVGESSDHPQLFTRENWKRGNVRPTWKIRVTQSGLYQLQMRFDAAEIDRVVTLKSDPEDRELNLPAGQSTLLFPDIDWRRGDNVIECDALDEEGNVSHAWQMLATRSGELGSNKWDLNTKRKRRRLRARVKALAETRKLAEEAGKQAEDG